ncbi:MerR family transcriptional regulator [Cellulomonas alba]|uniref:MerR family transcriptional regulator n=1 Tax=Cellulomonas alba TaxID=3053467 RepID=A0ABT7SIN9_9CELL|nr:MerR family transcriptional regulator [Cellulomonas alba]MDM7856048.1 MerR family transcriptional regulator [Cellulomonas alba]
MEASIQEVARLTGTTSRTLRHYQAVGLLTPSRVGNNGYRWYDEDALVRLQRILLLRELGLGLPEIARALEAHDDETAALRRHLEHLRAESRRLDRLVASVERTITAREEGAGLMAEDMFDGFDHTQYREEVEQRWGADAYRASNDWWTSMDAGEQAAWKARAADLTNAWSAAAGAGLDPTSDEAQALAQRHVDWLRSVPGTPRDDDGTPAAGYLLGLADMYVADDRFRSAYETAEKATFVRDAIRAWVAANR